MLSWASSGIPSIRLVAAWSTVPWRLTVVSVPEAAREYTEPSSPVTNALAPMFEDRAAPSDRFAGLGAVADVVHRVPSVGLRTPRTSPPCMALEPEGRAVGEPRDTWVTLTGATVSEVRSETVTVSPAWPTSKLVASVRRAPSRMRAS